jgi:hypothetical protein
MRVEEKSLAPWKAALIIGVLCLAYELVPFFGLALVFILIAKRNWIQSAVAALLLAAPSAMMAAILQHFAPLKNSNTATFGNILRAYLTLDDWPKYFSLLRRLPRDFVANFLFSNFLFIPVLFLSVVFLLKVKKSSSGLLRSEGALLVAALTLFLFNHLAPPYEGWQMRGEWIARLYQPVFVVFLVFIARNFAGLSDKVHKLALTSLGLCLMLNATIVFGPIFGAPAMAAEFYQRFYNHNQEMITDYPKNLQHFGRRPLGFCRASQ